MILAVGLSPAWQQILMFPKLRPGEVNRAAESHWCGSGKVLNVGLALHHLGADVHVLSPIGGFSGQSIQQEFQSLGIPATWIETQTPTRVCTTLLEQNPQQTTELVENSRPMTEAELDQFGQSFEPLARKADWIVFSGSLPAGTSPSFVRDLLGSHVARTILDIRGPELLEVLPLRPLLVKPNREELAKTLGRKLESESDLLAGMREIQAAGAQSILVTDGKRECRLLGPEGLIVATPPSCPVVNPIGCGDCMTAGVAWGISQNCNQLESLKLGMAAAAMNVGDLLPARLDPIKVKSIASQIAFPA